MIGDANADYDVLCYGALCADQRIWLPRYPQPGDGVRIIREDVVPGGNAFIEARALAAWGRSVVLMGDHLGDDTDGRLLRDAIAAIDLERAYLVYDATAHTPRCQILLTPDGQRTILARRDDHAPTTLPSAALLGRCRLMSITRYGPRTAEAARLARVAQRTVVIGDATLPDDAWACFADVIVTSADLIAHHAPGADVDAHIESLHQLRGATVIVTDGPRPVRALWHAAGRTHRFQASPPAITPRNTIGAGDVFRAAVVYGMLAEQSWTDIVHTACRHASAFVGRGTL